MESQSQDDQLIARYLLGELSEEEQTQLEERAFADREYSLYVRAVEKDLIDEYARGELAAARRQAFERRFFASEQRRRQIEFARALTQVTVPDSATAWLSGEPQAPTHSWWQAWLLLRRGPHLALGLAIVAIALIAIAVGVWLLRESRQRRTEQAQTQSPSQGITPSQSTATAQPTTDHSTQNVDRPTPVKGASPAPPQQPLIASLILLPGTSRSPENLPQLTIRPGTASAQLRISIDNGEPYIQFRGELHTTAGKLIAKQNLKAQSSRDGRIIVWLIPAGQLNSGEYELSLSGKGEQGKAEVVGYYYFKVLKK